MGVLRNGIRRFAIIGFSMLAASLPAFSQAAPPTAPPAATMPPAGEHHPAMPKPQNLQVLPKDISTSDLITLMREYQGQLGVECSYCHAGDPATHRLNFASDAKPEKAAARIMMTMTAELNPKYVATIPGYTGSKVNCGTCHRGHPMPAEFTAAPESNEKH